MDRVGLALAQITSFGEKQGRADAAHHPFSILVSSQTHPFKKKRHIVLCLYKLETTKYKRHTQWEFLLPEHSLCLNFPKPHCQFLSLSLRSKFYLCVLFEPLATAPQEMCAVFF